MKKYIITLGLITILLFTGCEGTIIKSHKYNIENYKIETINETTNRGEITGTSQQITIFYYDEKNILQHRTDKLEDADVTIKKVSNLKNNYIIIKVGKPDEVYLNK